MMRNVHRGLALVTAIGIAVAGCGDDGSGGGTDSVKAMLVDELCVPIEDEVAAWAGHQSHLSTIRSMPRDSWLLDRGNTQLAEEFFPRVA